MAQDGEAATASVESVSFGFLTDKEVRKNSFVKIINPILLDQLDRPAPGGLYDPAMGPIEERDSCRQCGLKGFKCTGHCGHVELVAPLYNPLMFRMLCNLLQKTCFHCHKFRDEMRQVRRYTSKLALILKGDIVGAKSLDFSSDSSPSEDNNTSYTTHERCPSSNSEVDDHIFKDSEQHSWTSLQYKEAMSVLSEFVKNKAKQCSKCKFKNPTITCPTFGWMHANLSRSSGRANAIVDYNLEGLTTEEVEERKNVVDSDEMESSGVDDDGTLESTSESYKPMSFTGPLLPSEVKDKIKRLWDNETQLCSLICDIQGKRLCTSEKNRDYSMFFIEALLVPPIKFRAPSKGGDSVTAHAQTVLLSKVLQSNISLGNSLVKKADHSKIVPRWMELQQSVNFLFGNKKTMGQGENAITGICQLLEKKDGIFRQKMMGKRVNYACRSVISPDPYLAVNEIGIPPYFALRLTYPERVTPWNVDKLRNCIINGPLIHPGATNYMDKLKSQKLPENNRKTRISISRKLPSSIGCVSQLGNTVGQVHEGKIVYRHIQDGDIVLVNRQPTLHKPSIMAHVVRVLKGEKTLRMHYANCSTYNADFDGDELNVHFPQDEISRAEAYNIVNANNQYIIPTSGDTRRGLIQDHIVSAVLLTKKDTFLTKDEYNHLLYSSGIFATARGSFTGKPGKKVSMVNIEDEIEPILPAILKPEPLWSGKQIITSLLHHITRTKALPPLTVEKRATIPSKYFGGRNEGYLLIRKNEFVDGVVDKAQFGKYGLVHTVQEFYGSDTAGILLSGLSRLFTVFLQMHGFTCGVDDLLLERSVDMERIKLLGDAKNIGQAVYFDFANEADETENKDGGKIDKDVRNELGDFKDKHIDPVKLQMDVERAVRVNGESAISVLDTMMASAINELTSKVNNNVISLPKGLQKPFPDNCFILMTISGAKGGQVNFSQISSLLGQQSLEGKRVPLMISGKTLPCFPPWEPAPRAGGFISDCFLSGLRPQEYYFHCMAGREGLVDTAVKTSRSGYLQRCLVKNLECLKVGYDHTVRDADGSIVQFCYGEDGVDVHKTSFLSEFDKLASNQRVLVEKHANQYQDAKSVNSDSFIRDLPEALEERAQRFITELSKKQRATFNLKRRKDFMNLVKLKYQSSLAQPGEPVGVIAAQSVGEPSTQMTLNTFHHAGQKESNVTLGIPRLQEILMRASENMQTPVMQCSLKEGKTKEDAQRLAEKLRKVTVADIIERIEVGIVPFSVENHRVSTIYKLKMKLFKPELYPPSSNITLEDCHDTLKVFFVEELEKAIQNHLTMLSKISGIKNIVERTENITVEETDEAEPHRKQKEAGLENDDDNENDDDDGDETEEQDADSRKRRRQATDEIDYEDSMESENTVSENKDIEEDALTKIESDVDVVGVEVDSKGDDNKILVNTEDESTTGSLSKSKKRDKELKAESRKEGARARRVKETDRTIFVEAKGLDFEVHLRFTDDPHVLLSQIAHKAAKNIYIKSSGNIDECSVVAVKESIVENGYLVEKEHQGLHTAGVNFGAFWDMQDDLDVRKITSNDIHAILHTYGIEAARATLIKEVKAVFQTHGASVDVRHLSLIADFMTHSGQYRPMSRHGMAASTSPLSKMSFETASTFIVEAAYHGLVDDLESPSARICLGLPVKMGTGSFDLMQKIQF